MNAADKRHVFTYGSLMFAPVWSRVVRGSHAPVAAQVRGFDRRAIRGETYPAVVPSADPATLLQGVLYPDVGSEDLARLDRFEGEDYRRIDVQATRLDDGSACTATMYLYLRTERMLPQPWDVAQFEQRDLALFLSRYGGF